MRAGERLKTRNQRRQLGGNLARVLERHAHTLGIASRAARRPGDLTLNQPSECDADRRYAELSAKRGPRFVARLDAGHPVARLASLRFLHLCALPSPASHVDSVYDAPRAATVCGA